MLKYFTLVLVCILVACGPEIEITTPAAYGDSMSRLSPDLADVSADIVTAQAAADGAQATADVKSGTEFHSANVLALPASSYQDYTRTHVQGAGDYQLSLAIVNSGAELSQWNWVLLDDSGYCHSQRGDQPIASWPATPAAGNVVLRVWNVNGSQANSTFFRIFATKVSN